MAPGGICHYFNEENPSNYKSLINKYASILVDEEIYNGYIDAIDPLSGSVILSRCVDNEIKIILLPGHAIKNIECKEPPSGCIQHIEKMDENMNAEAAEIRKNDVHSWLLRNLLPVEEKDGVLLVHGDMLRIVSPYRSEDCFSNNSIILGRIQHLLQNIPKDSPDDNFT